MKRFALSILFVALAVGGAYADFAGTGFSNPPLPSQAGNGGKVLTTDGSVASWGGAAILDNVAGPTAAQMYGSWNIVNADITVTLPTAVAGMNGCVRDTGTVHDVIVDVQTGDDISLLGAEDTNGDGITNASGTSTGDYVCVVSSTNGHWLVTVRQGTWAQQ